MPGIAGAPDEWCPVRRRDRPEGWPPTIRARNRRGTAGPAATPDEWCRVLRGDRPGGWPPAGAWVARRLGGPGL